MFSVYGRSRDLAKKKINNDFFKGKIKIDDSLSQSEKQKEIDILVDEEFINGKIKKCTHDLSTPELSLQALELMKNDKVNFSDLVLMKKVNKKNAEDQDVVSKTTGKPMYKWVTMHD